MLIRHILTFILLFSTCILIAQVASIESPDKQLRVDLHIDANKLFYSVNFKGQTVLEKSPLGFISNEGDFINGISFESSTDSVIEKQYTQDRIKVSTVSYYANVLKTTLSNADKK